MSDPAPPPSAASRSPALPVEVLAAPERDHHGPSQGVRPSRARSVWARVFDIGPRGWTRLALASLAVGLVVRAAELNPFSGEFTIPDALGAIVTAVAGMFAWALANGWAPFLMGALLVMPVFILWRLVSMPFRMAGKDAAPHPSKGPRWGR